MKRIVILIDGTWDKEGITGNAALDPGDQICHTRLHKEQRWERRCSTRALSQRRRRRGQTLQ
jgi:hypothetical protein